MTKLDSSLADSGDAGSASGGAGAPERPDGDPRVGGAGGGNVRAPDPSASSGGGPRRPSGRRALSAGHVLVVVGVGLLLAALLGAADLVSAGERLPTGPWRTVVLGIGCPLVRVASFLLLDRPLEYVHSLRAGGDEGSGGTGGAVATAGAAATSTGSTLASGSMDSKTATTTATTKGATTMALATPTVDKPLRVWVGGDSMVEQVGIAFINMSDGIKTMKVKMQTKISSGLCRPDYYNWPLVIQQVKDEYAPQASVVMFGGNDMQGLEENGKSLAVWSPEWTKAYGKRVAQVIEILTAGGGHVYWLGAPPMRAEQDSRWARDLDRIYEDVCSRYPQATYIDGWELFSNEDGGYAVYLPNASGRSRLVREPDGIHFTQLGGDRAAAEILKEMRKRWVLKAQ